MMCQKKDSKRGPNARNSFCQRASCLKAGEFGLAEFTHLALQVVLDADLAGQFDLGFQEVDVLFGVVQNVLEQVARHIVAHAFRNAPCRP